MSIRNYEEYRKQVLDGLGVDYTVEDLRNFERWRLKVIAGLEGISHDPEVIKQGVADWLEEHPEAIAGVTAEELAEILTGYVTESEFLKAFIVETASGDIASFTDGADDVPVKSLSVNIAPKQSGSGDPSPSNVRPISGWDEVEVVRTGVNIWDEEWEVGGINVSNGQNIADSTVIRSKNYIPVTPNAVYYLYCGTQATFNYRLYDSNKAYISGTYIGRNSTLTIPSTASYMRFTMGSSYGTTYNHDISINYPSTDTSYHPYQGTSYPITLPSTVYGGTLDVVSGVLTVTHKALNLGSVNWAKNNTSSGHWWFAYTTGDAKKPSSSSSVANIICSNYKSLSADQAWLGTQGIGVNNANTNIIVVDSTYSDTASFKSAMNGVMAVYELETPITTTLTGEQINTLLGSNNIWSDAGTVEVEYRADSTLAYNELAATVLENVGN